MPGSASRIRRQIAPAAAALPSRSERIYRLVVFDLDGTLVDSSRDLCEAVNLALEALHLPALPEKRILGFVGNGARRLIERGVEAAAPGAPVAVVDEALAFFQRYYAEHCLDRTRLYPGIEPALRALRAVGTLAVLTNKPRAFAEQILAGLGIRGLFEAVVGGDDLRSRKPEPEGLLFLAASSGCGVREAVLVGDSPVDLETARNAGVDSCAVTWGFVAEAELAPAGPTRIVRRPADLLTLVR